MAQIIILNASRVEYTPYSQTAVNITEYYWYNSTDSTKRIFRTFDVVEYEDNDSINIIEQRTEETLFAYQNNQWVAYQPTQIDGSGLFIRKNSAGSNIVGSTLTDLDGNLIVYERAYSPRGSDTPKYFTNSKGIIVSEIKGVSEYNKRTLYQEIKDDCSDTTIKAIKKRADDIIREAKYLLYIYDKIGKDDADQKIINSIAPTLVTIITGSKLSGAATALIFNFYSVPQELKDKERINLSLAALEKEYKSLESRSNKCNLNQNDIGGDKSKLKLTTIQKAILGVLFVLVAFFLFKLRSK